MSSRVPADAAARRNAIFATGSVLVQAPAGSGKTTLLAQRYLRLLATVDAPERILALTFTRRAAQEMRARVLLALEAAELPECPLQLNAQTWELGQAARRRMSALGFDLERHSSRLRIETIDAFNAWLAGRLPITAGAGASSKLTDSPQPLYDEAARRALAHNEGDDFAPAVDQLLALGDQRWGSLVDLIAGMLPTRDRWLPLLAGRLQASRALAAEPLAAVRRHMDEDLELLVARVLKTAHEALGPHRMHALCTLMRAAARRLAAASEDTASAPLAEWCADSSALRPAAGDVARWRSMAALVLTEAGEYRARFTKKEGFPPGCLDRQPMLDLVQELARTPHVLRLLTEVRRLPDPRYDDDQWGRVRAVAQVLVLAAARLEQVFRERGTADFPAVSMAAVRALGTACAPTDLGLRLDYRLQHILVDEFQDTSSAQLELINLLTAGWQRGDGRSVFCVGDPMQSIYGFRQAEVRAFLELAEEGIGDVQFQVERLRSNFRSAEPLVDWINARFAAILPSSDDRERGAIAFRPSDAARHDVAPAGEEGAGVMLRGCMNRRAEADAIAASVADAAARHPQWRVAILVRARTHARELAASLRARAIDFRAVDLEPLQDRPVVRDLVMLVRALLHLGDRVAWLALLRAPWVGLVLADLLRVARGAHVIWQALADPEVLAGLSDDGRERCARLYRTLEAAFRVRTRGSVVRWVEQTWLALGGPACAGTATDLDHVGAVFRRLRDLEEDGLPDPADIAASFSNLYAEYHAGAAVEIMTIHKAKGLEFDMVIVPALDRHIPLHRNQLLRSHEFARAGRDGLVLAARPGIGAERDALFDFLSRQARDADSLEAERLLYVACTRAKARLLLTATVGAFDEVSEDDSTPKPWRPRMGSLLAVLWPVAAADFAVESDGSSTTDPGAPAQAPRGGWLKRVPKDWSPASDDLRFDADVPPSTTIREETPVFDWAGETARRVGILVHAELQRMDPAQSDAASISARAVHYRLWLKRHGVPSDRLAEAGSRVVAALVAVLDDERAHWILKRRARDDLREHALSIRDEGRAIRVVFDRSFVDQGVRWVIDYKTSQHAGGSVEQFLDREVERYRPQLYRYAHVARQLGNEPVRVGLYFPLMRAWREWEP